MLLCVLLTKKMLLFLFPVKDSPLAWLISSLHSYWRARAPACSLSVQSQVSAMAGERVYVCLAMGMLLIVLVVGEAYGESGSGSESGDLCGPALESECESTSSILPTIFLATHSLEATPTTVMLSGMPPMSLPLDTRSTTPLIMSPSPTEDGVPRGSEEEGDGAGLGQGAVTGIVLGSLYAALLVLVVCLALGYWAREKRKRANKVG